MEETVAGVLKPKRRLRRLFMYFLLAVGLLALAVGAALVVRAMRHPTVVKPAAATPKPAGITYTTDTPSESKPAAAAYRWKGGPTDPKRIQIKAIGVDTFLQPMDVDQHGEMAAPNNIWLAGWFVRSVRPGDQGLSIIDGHLNGRTSKGGVFGKLDSLQAGDIITVTRGDDSTVTYRVTAVQNPALDQVPAILYSQDPANTQGQLNLITCSGNYDSDIQRYDHRTVITSASVR